MNASTVAQANQTPGQIDSLLMGVYEHQGGEADVETWAKRLQRVKQKQERLAQCRIDALLYRAVRYIEFFCSNSRC